jgi:hypothetical protein
MTPIIAIATSPVGSTTASGYTVVAPQHVSKFAKVVPCRSAQLPFLSCAATPVF